MPPTVAPTGPPTTVPPTAPAMPAPRPPNEVAILGAASRIASPTILDFPAAWRSCCSWRILSWKAMSFSIASDSSGIAVPVTSFWNAAGTPVARASGIVPMADTTSSTAKNGWSSSGSAVGIC